MQFDRFTISLLILRPDAPQLDEAAAAALQDAHMAHLANLHQAGHLLAAGPLAFADPTEQFRGLSILNVEPEQARALEEQDPAIRAGRFSIKVLPWMVPAGAMTLHPPASSARRPKPWATESLAERSHIHGYAPGTHMTRLTRTNFQDAPLRDPSGGGDGFQ